MVGATLSALREEGLLRSPTTGGHVSVKEAVLPFDRFPDVDTLLGPEMRSTGEVMGIDRTFGLAFAKSQIAAGDRLPEGGSVFLSLAERDKPGGLRAALRFVELGFSLVATAGTAAYLEDHGVPVETVVAKVGEPGVDAAAGLVPTGPTSAGPQTSTRSPASPPWPRPGPPPLVSPTGPITGCRCGACRSFKPTISSGCRYEPETGETGAGRPHRPHR
jgi:hypothetical protein